MEDPRTLYDQRYNYLRKEHGLGFEGDPAPDAGKPSRIDFEFVGGERVAVDTGWNLQVLHVPGHSRGHLALHDASHKAAFVRRYSWTGCPNANRTMAIPVTYFYVDIYLSTLRYFEALPLDALYSGHWPTMHGEDHGGLLRCLIE